MSLTYSFLGKKVLVTGGASGIGRQLVQRLYDKGATVFTFDRNAKAIQQLNEELPKVNAQVVDLVDWNETRRVVESYGKLDHLVNNAAASAIEKFMDITKEEANRQYAVNVEAVINVSQVVAKGMIESGSGGSIVNVSSTMAHKYMPGVSAYGASKAALTALTRFMAVELGEHGIRVNCIQPGAVDTPMIKNKIGEFPNTVQRIIEQETVLKRVISTNEIADLVFFLLSPLSGAITGQAINIDGGWMK